MTNNALVECVPNFSEGRDEQTIKEISDVIVQSEGVRLLDVDPGKATNRTVVTFVGHPEHVINAAFHLIKKAAELIDMSKHTGEHPRMGATDVCPLIPISGISMEETAEYAHRLAKRVGEELSIPCYLYEEAATKPERKNLATVRSGEYEGFKKKILEPEWKPDYGPAVYNAKSGCTAIGARDFLVAYNVNLNTKSVRRANAIAFDVRENGRVMRDGDPITGTIVRDEHGEARRVSGTCKSVKAIGWYIEEYGIAQISMNLTNISDTSLHEAFEACRISANNRGMRVTGSELVGLVPKKVLIDAGKYFLEKQQRSKGVSEDEIIHIAIKSLGLDELSEFDPKKKIIEYLLENDNDSKLTARSLESFANETASESPAPGGGSISAYVGALGIALGNMVANLSAHKRGWDDQWEMFSDWAEAGMAIQEKLMYLVDEDTAAFNKIIEVIRLPKQSKEEKQKRSEAIQSATKYAIEVPLEVMKTAFLGMDLLKAMAEKGNPNSVSDAGVGAHCVGTAVYGAFLNVKINCADCKDVTFVEKIMAEAQQIYRETEKAEEDIIKIVNGVIEKG